MTKVYVIPDKDWQVIQKYIPPKLEDSEYRDDAVWVPEKVANAINFTEQDANEANATPDLYTCDDCPLAIEIVEDEDNPFIQTYREEFMGLNENEEENFEDDYPQEFEDQAQDER